MSLLLFVARARINGARLARGLCLMVVEVSEGGNNQAAGGKATHGIAEIWFVNPCRRCAVSESRQSRLDSLLPEVFEGGCHQAVKI